MSKEGLGDEKAGLGYEVDPHGGGDDVASGLGGRVLWTRGFSGGIVGAPRTPPVALEGGRSILRRMTDDRSPQQTSDSSPSAVPLALPLATPPGSVDEAATARYDAAYYAHGCGDRPYARDEVWLGFFGDVAERIVADIAPRTVLDAGCAMGFLVETLRARGVEAWGVDVSEYAISQVHGSVREHCAVGSILEPFERRYDLITCIEVLEHLDAVAGAKAIANLCAATDDVLFSSTPEDFREPTHENVQPPDYWAAAFARHGFYRDVDFDGSFLTPWAVRFRRHDGPMAPVIAAYERALWWMRQENAQRREAVAESEREGRELRVLRERVAGMEEELAGVREEVARLRGERAAAVAEAEREASRRGWIARLEGRLRHLRR